jgi:DNA-binding NarL/FixJ family response regulator
MSSRRTHARPEVFPLDGPGELVVISMPVGAGDDGQLSEAELAVARAAAAGLSNAEIARQRGTSARTVANQLAAVYDKLDVASRAQLAARLLESS